MFNVREIKFRAWSINNNCYVSIDIHATPLRYNPSTGQMYYDGLNVTSQYIMEQYIGRKDCKRTKEFPEGQEIYEGDIVKCKTQVGHIKFDYCTVVYCSQYASYKCATNRDTFTGLTHHYENIEIIGNKHENPELLK